MKKLKNFKVFFSSSFPFWFSMENYCPYITWWHQNCFTCYKFGGMSKIKVRNVPNSQKERPTYEIALASILFPVSNFLLSSDLSLFLLQIFLLLFLLIFPWSWPFILLQIHYITTVYGPLKQLAIAKRPRQGMKEIRIPPTPYLISCTITSFAPWGQKPSGSTTTTNTTYTNVVPAL